MTQIASLKIEVETTTVDKTVQVMRQLSEVSERSASQVDALAASARSAMNPLGGMSGSLTEIGQSLASSSSEFDRAASLTTSLGTSFERTSKSTISLAYEIENVGEAAKAASKTLDEAGKTAGFNSEEMIKLNKSFLELGASILTGEEPLKAIINTIPDVAEVFMEAGARGVGFKDALIDLGKQYGLLTTSGAKTVAGVATATEAYEAQAAAALEAALAQGDLSAAVMAGSVSSEAAAASATVTAGANEAMGAAAAEAATAEAVALAPLGAILAAVAVAVGVVAGGFALAAQHMNDTGESADQVQQRLGLTDEQMKKVGSTAITTGDVFRASLKVAGDYIGQTLGPVFSWLGNVVSGFFKGAIDGAVGFLRGMIGTAGAVVGGFKAAFELLPRAIGEIMINMANFAIDAIQSLLNGAIGMINDIIKKANAAAAAVGFKIELPTISPASLAKIPQAYAGAGQKAMSGLKSAIDAGSADALAATDGMVKKVEGGLKVVGDKVTAQASAYRDAEVKARAGDPAKPAATPYGGGATADYGGQGPEKAADDFGKLAAASEESTKKLAAQTAEQEKYNAMVRAGTMTVEQAAAAQKAANDQLELAKAGADPQRLAQIATLQEEAAKAARDKAAADADSYSLKTAQDQQKELDRLQMELSLVGKTNRERAEGLAVYKAEQDLKAKGYDPATATPQQAADAQKVIDNARKIADAQEDIREKTEAASKALKDNADALKAVGKQGEETANALAKAFGDVGKSLGDMLKLFNAYVEKQREFDKRRKDASDAGHLDEVAKIDKEAAAAQKKYYGDVIQAAEDMVDKKSNAYQALMTAEKIYRAFQFAMSVKAAVMAQWEAAQSITAGQAQTAADTAQTAVIATNNGVKSVTGTAAGAGNMFSQLGVAAFPFVAAMIAMMASLGSGSASASIPGEHDAENRQKAQGTGSVLGDASAKSESIKKSLELVADHTNTMLEFYNPMLTALRSIDSQIGAVASALARSFGVGGMLSTEGLKLGTSGNAPSLSNLGFGSVTTKTLQDQGLNFVAGTLGAILAGGLQGQTYQQILSQTKKSAFGLTYSTSTSKKTVLGALDPEFARQTTLLIGSLRDGVVAAASTLGIEGAAATLDAFKLDLGKISLKDLKGDEITQALEAVFGKAADQMAAAVMPGLEQFQKVGEGAFETLTRLARDYQVVDVTLKSIGKVFGTVGVASVEARERLVELSGGLDNFTSQASFYADNFLTEAERLAPIQDAVTAELARLGLTGVKTRDQFKAVVQGLDVSTEAGAQLYAALMTLAPAFAAVTQESQALSDAKDALSGAYERESGALQDTHDRFADLAKSLHDFGAGLYSGPAAALSPEEQYRAAQAAFQQTAGLAAQGNEQALGDLQNVSQAYLDASKAYYASSEGYFADLAAVRDAVSAAEASATGQADVAQQQLDAMTEQVGQLIDLNTHVVTVAEAIAALNLLLGGGGQSPVVDPALPKSGSASNDNAVVSAIQELQTEVAGVGDQLAADKTQRAAIAEQQDARLAALEDQLAAMRRAAQA